LLNGRAMPSQQITSATVDSWTKSDSKVLLLRLARGQELPTAIQRYLDSGAGREARRGYKCRNRKPWYVVPDVQIPDFIMSYMAGRSANLVLSPA
jgi:adenine-specific DNA-methyltransferase